MKLQHLSFLYPIGIRLLTTGSKPTLLVLQRMASTGNGLSSLKPLVGVCQMTCTADKEANFAISQSLIEKAKQLHVQMVFLPEACDYIADSKEQSVQMAEPLDGDLISRYKDLARKNQIWLSIGGFHQKGSVDDPRRVYNTHIIINSFGSIAAIYNKSHLFDLDLKDRVHLCESDYTIPGQHIVSPVVTPIGKVGLSTCYDVRFPELSVALTQLGADILTYPSAFTQTTGMAHWEVLLRARAIENQCYVIAAAQTGKHNDKRTSYGHAMVVDPWGTVVAQCKEGTGIAIAEIDLVYLNQIRQEMPVRNHRRHDLYPQLVPLQCTSDDVDKQALYQFGHVSLESSCVFARTALSFAFVNIKPILPGHMLIASHRPVERLCDLTAAEVSDLFYLVQCVSNVVQRLFEASSLTVAVQDGPDAGQTVKHVHVHIIPRKAGDFDQNDDIYYELQKHDRDMHANSKGLRTREEMAQEALMMRGAFQRSL